MSDTSKVQVVVLDPDDYECFAAESVAFEEATFRGESPMKVRAGGDADEASSRTPTGEQCGCTY